MNRGMEGEELVLQEEGHGINAALQETARTSGVFIKGKPSLTMSLGKY